MSDTPETGFNEMLASEFNADTWVVSASFARQLERESAARKSEADAWRLMAKRLARWSYLLKPAFPTMHLEQGGDIADYERMLKESGEPEDQTEGGRK